MPKPKGLDLMAQGLRMEWAHVVLELVLDSPPLHSGWEEGLGKI